MDEYEFNVPSGNHRVEVVLFYGPGAEDYSVQRRNYYELFEFVISLVPNKKYKADAYVKNRAATLCLVDSDDKAITEKKRKVLKPVLRILKEENPLMYMIPNMRVR